MNFVDLFCGIGGFRLALEARGHQCVFSCEIDENARESYNANFGELPAGDIRSVEDHQIPKHDILCAGFPCQSFSLAGKLGGFSDDRGTLFFEILRFIKIGKPSIVLLENVPNILSIDEGRVVGKICRSIEDLGYRLDYSILNASHFGIPQSRRRVYFVGLKDGDYTPPSPTHEQICVGDIMEDSVEDNLFVSDKYTPIWTGTEPMYNMHRPVKLGYYHREAQGQRIYSVLGHAVTQSALGGGRGAKTGLYKVDGGVRRLSLLEGKRVMGFPDHWNVGVRDRGRTQLGNAIIPAMVGHVFDGIKN